ncbi:MAG TPA: hypothetical protein VKV74_15685 [Bryobacteraceae bacterium]|nr:hypothetical protein [Bryobacteraceae bacterium]
MGPAIEARLPLGLAVEFDALYRPFGYDLRYQTCCSSGTITERTSSWEFPIIAKYRLPEGRLHPFAGVGYDPRTIQGIDAASGSYYPLRHGLWFPADSI